MKQLFRILERLSLDAVLVAVVWGFALGGAGPEMGILAMATWLTYVADRLWEVRPGKVVPETDRHLYYKNNYETFRILWAIGFAAAVLLSFKYLPGWKMGWGWVLVAVITGYLWMIGNIRNTSHRLLLKRIIVPLVFVSGIVWMTESWRSEAVIVGSVILMSAALSNVLLISYWENHDKEMPEWLPRLTVKSLMALLICTTVIMPMHWQSGLAGLFCFAGYGYLFWMIRKRRASYARAWVDGILVVAGIVVVLL